MDELLKCADAHVEDVFGGGIDAPKKGVLVSIYAYVTSGDNPKKNLSTIRQSIQMGDYVGFNRCMEQSKIKDIYEDSVKDISLRDEFNDIGKDVLIMFANWRDTEWRKSLLSRSLG